MISCKRIPKPSAVYDTSVYVSERTNKKRKKPPIDPPNDIDLQVSTAPLIPIRAFHLRRKKFPPLGYRSKPFPTSPTPAPPTPPLPTTNENTETNITINGNSDELKIEPTDKTYQELTDAPKKEITDDLANTPTPDITNETVDIKNEIIPNIAAENNINNSNNTNITSNINNTGNINNIDNLSNLNNANVPRFPALPPSSAPSTPIVIDFGQTTNDVITATKPDPPNNNDVTATTPIPKKSHKKLIQPVTQPRTTSRIPKPKKIISPTSGKTYHIKFQNGHLTKTTRTKPTPVSTKLQLTKTSKLQLAKKTKLQLSKNVKSAKTKTKDKGKVGRPKKVAAASIKKDDETEDDEFVDGAEKQYYKTDAAQATKKRAKAKSGNCVHCKKGNDVESVVICDAGCGRWFHASCAGYAKPLQESEYTMALCKKCLAENDLTCKDIHYFEEEYEIIQAWCKENDWTLQNIDNDGMCLFSSVFQWLDKDAKLSRNLYRVENLVKGVTRELQQMISMNELPIITEFKAHLMKDIQGVLKSSHNLARLWNSHYEGLGIGDYFIAAVEKYLQVGICIYHVLGGTVCVRQKSELYSTTCNVVLRSEKYAAHYDLLLANKKQ